jgi:formamidopyrimidine-DNA glycosylase
MPELAEVEYFRRRWDAGRGDRVVKILLHAGNRVFRATNTRTLREHLTDARLLRSEARGKRMLFRFSADSWLGLHLGMSGKLRIEKTDFRPQKHDHLVLYQCERALVFADPRQFGRVQFHYGQTPPEWWNETIPEIDSPQFNRAFFDDFLDRHRKAPIKAVLLMQSGFSGIGNWMADEILWRARVLPSKSVIALTGKERAALFRATRFVARVSLRLMAHDLSDPPKSWLIHQRWRDGGKCPRHGTALRRATIGGRTTAWCPKCQR